MLPQSDELHYCSFCKIVKSFKLVQTYISNCVNYKLEAKGLKSLINFNCTYLLLRKNFLILDFTQLMKISTGENSGV